jgi:hypothetical protein
MPGKVVIVARGYSPEIVQTHAGVVHANFVDPEARQNGVVSVSLGKNPVAPKPGDTAIDPQAAKAYRGLIDRNDGSNVTLEHAPPRFEEMSKFTLPDTVRAGGGAYGTNIVLKNDLYIDFKTNTAYVKVIDTYTAPDGSAFRWLKLGEPLEFASSAK